MIYKFIFSFFKAPQKYTSFIYCFTTYRNSFRIEFKGVNNSTLTNLTWILLGLFNGFLSEVVQRNVSDQINHNYFLEFDIVPHPQMRSNRRHIAWDFNYVFAAARLETPCTQFGGGTKSKWINPCATWLFFAFSL